MLVMDIRVTPRRKQRTKSSKSAYKQSVMRMEMPIGLLPRSKEHREALQASDYIPACVFCHFNNRRSEEYPNENYPPRFCCRTALKKMRPTCSGVPSPASEILGMEREQSQQKHQKMFTYVEIVLPCGAVLRYVV